MAQRIDCKSVDKEFYIYYTYMGRKATPVRKIIGCMILKQMHNLGDEAFVDRWIENPYWQYFCGETFFQYEQPFDPRKNVNLTLAN